MYDAFIGCPDWRDFRAEITPQEMAAQFVRLGATRSQLIRIFGKSLNKPDLEHLRKLLRKSLNNEFNRGRLLDLRSIRRLSSDKHADFVQMMTYLDWALEQGCDPVESLLAAWLVLDGSRQSTQKASEEGFRLWLTVWEKFVNFQVGFIRCAKCGAVNLRVFTATTSDKRVEEEKGRAGSEVCDGRGHYLVAGDHCFTSHLTRKDLPFRA